MSYFSEALSTHMERNGFTNLTFAALTDLNDSDISRWKRGVGSPPSDKALTKILPAVPADVALHLCICWLKDETPESMRARIAIQPVQQSAATDMTREDWQRALDFFIHGCEHNSLMRATLVGLHRLMTKNDATQPRFELKKIISGKDLNPSAEEKEASLVNEDPPAENADDRLKAAIQRAKPKKRSKGNDEQKAG